MCPTLTCSRTPGESLEKDRWHPARTLSACLASSFSSSLLFPYYFSPEPQGLEAAVDRRSLPSMPATDLSSHGAFARLARAFVEVGAAEHLPVLPKVGASDLDSAVALASAAVAACTPPTWRRPPQKSSFGRPGAAGGHTASGLFTGSPRRRRGRPGAFGVFPTGVKRRHRVRQRRRRPRPLLPARAPPTRSRRRARPANEKMFAPLRLASATCVLAPSGRHFFLLQRPLCLKPSLHSAVAGVARPTMASTPLIAAAMADFADVAKASGAGPDMLEYLEARSLHRTATLALVADTWDDVDKKVFRPFADGFLAKGKKLQARPPSPRQAPA